ncbi:MAG: hypothetical protein FJZ01_27420 [Candidatus Sericytochromatia bacterium]|nr:hypothetical protein [Candidatus Tanganyikabacteria bacterium]
MSHHQDDLAFGVFMPVIAGIRPEDLGGDPAQARRFLARMRGRMFPGIGFVPHQEPHHKADDWANQVQPDPMFLIDDPADWGC